MSAELLSLILLPLPVRPCLLPSTHSLLPYAALFPAQGTARHPPVTYALTQPSLKNFPPSTTLPYTHCPSSVPPPSHPAPPNAFHPYPLPSPSPPLPMALHSYPLPAPIPPPRFLPSPLARCLTDASDISFASNFSLRLKTRIKSRSPSNFFFLSIIFNYGFLSRGRIIVFE